MVRESVAANNRLLVGGAASADPEAMASVYEDDAHLLPPNAEAIQGREAISRYWQAGIEMGLRRLELETAHLQHAHDLAVEVGRFAVWMQPDGGEPSAEIGKYVVVHRRQPDDSWRRSVEIFNWDAPVIG